MAQTAIVIGATGATGSVLVSLLLSNTNYSKVVVIARRSIAISHPKLEEHIIDFETLTNHTEIFKGDVLFSCLGTTMAKAKTKQNQYTIDYIYQFNAAQIAAQNGVKKYILISSIGAHAKSFNFYLKMKGSLDLAVSKLNFETIKILRPGPIDAGISRDETRNIEKSSIKTLRFVNKLGMFKKYKPITTQELATAMLHCAESTQKGMQILESTELFKCK